MTKIIVSDQKGFLIKEYESNIIPRIGEGMYSKLEQLGGFFAVHKVDQVTHLDENKVLIILGDYVPVPKIEF